MGGDLTARVEGVEGDFAGALPLSDVDLRGPAFDGGEPKGGPGALGHGRLEVGLEVVAAAGLDGELLLGEHGTRQVVHGVLLAAVGGGRLPARGRRRQRQHAVGRRHLGRAHARPAVVVRPPRVVVAPVRGERGAERVLGDHRLAGRPARDLGEGPVDSGIRRGHAGERQGRGEERKTAHVVVTVVGKWYAKRSDADAEWEENESNGGQVKRSERQVRALGKSTARDGTTILAALYIID